MTDASKLNHLNFERQVAEMTACKDNNGETQKDRVLNWIQAKGAVICDDPIMKLRLAEYITPVAAMFTELLENLYAVYPYYMSKQGNEELRKDGGVCWEYHDTKTGKVVFAIGISVEGMEQGLENAQFLFLHELAHIAAGGHIRIAQIRTPGTVAPQTPLLDTDRY